LSVLIDAGVLVGRITNSSLDRVVIHGDVWWLHELCIFPLSIACTIIVVICIESGFEDSGWIEFVLTGLSVSKRLKFE